MDDDPVSFLQLLNFTFWRRNESCCYLYKEWNSWHCFKL